MGSAISWFRDELFGVINEEMPKYDVVQKSDNFEIRQYGPAIVAETTFRGKRGQSKASTDAFWVLAGYIGAVSAPKNVKASEQSGAGAEAIAMTAPVVMNKTDAEPIAVTAPVVMSTTEAEPIAMTAPVVMQKAEAEAIAMTAPVVMAQKTDAKNADSSTGPGPDLSEADLMSRAMKTYMDWANTSAKDKNAQIVTQSMQFILPSKYTMETVPKPLDPRVVIKEVPGKKVGAVVFNGAWNEEQFKEKAAKLKDSLETAGHKTKGDYASAMYNSPLALPSYRRNEIWYELQE